VDNNFYFIFLFNSVVFHQIIFCHLVQMTTSGKWGSLDPVVHVRRFM